MYPPIVFGGGAYNTQYNIDDIDDVSKTLAYAFQHGITAIDTAAFYGPSEEMIGQALKKLNFDRSKLLICTKCCRFEDGSFDYTAEGVNRSILRSLKRLNVEYLDVVYIHDIEFTTPLNALEAVQEAFKLKKKGLVKNVGISGYPLPTLLKLCKLSKEPIDCVLSYCNLNLQNCLLLEYVDKFKKAGVKHVLNASPLSMSMLRSQPTHKFHMASSEMQFRADQICSKLKQNGIEMADVATQYALASFNGPTVIGLRTIGEIDAVLKNQKISREKPDHVLWDKIINDFGEFHNAVWEEPLYIKYKPSWDEVS